MAKVSDATTAVGSDADWFKVQEIGLPSSSPDYWGTGEYSPHALKAFCLSDESCSIIQRC